MMRRHDNGGAGHCLGVRAALARTLGCALARTLGCALVALVCSLSPQAAFADSEIIYTEQGAWPGDLTEVSPGDDAFAEEGRPGKGIAFLASIGSVVFSAVTFPVKVVVGVTGALAGGLAGGLTGGNREAAEGIWDVTTDGSYFVTPEVLEGRKRFHLTDEED